MRFYNFELDEDQEALVKTIRSPGKDIVFSNSVAGSGKTTIAMGVANLIVQDKRNDIDGIYYIMAPYGESRQGYLPGGQAEKSSVYFKAAVKAMVECNMIPHAVICKDNPEDKKTGDGYVWLMTTTYLRGDNFSKKVIIIDEAQNCTVGDLKTILTRIHDDCKVLVIGHTGQIDITSGSGFAKYIEHYEDQERAAVCELTVNHRGWISNHADKLVEN